MEIGQHKSGGGGLQGGQYVVTSEKRGDSKNLVRLMQLETKRLT